MTDKTDDQNVQEKDVIPPPQESAYAPARTNKPKVDPAANAACVVARGPGVSVAEAIEMRAILHDLF